MIAPNATARCRTCGTALTPRERQKEAAEAQAAMQAACDAFNATHAVGDVIRCWTGPREGAPVLRVIKAPAEILRGHTAVVFVSGGGGCIALSHISDA
ncbi:hypothetical protein [Mesorhizobium sp. NZP2234]|uniref:hypothetical protein n=1 Tax=Mesorhizobium sp. NZP2234 TaxID=2483402 RepID=UPI0015534750|nr:hypothetical protein [Mesorhizobium sp. NZP2234]